MTVEQSCSVARSEEPSASHSATSRQLVTPRDTRLRRTGDLIPITILDPIMLGDDRTVSVADQGGHRDAILPQRRLSQPCGPLTFQHVPPRGNAHASKELLSCPLLFPLRYALRLSGRLSVKIPR